MEAVDSSLLFDQRYDPPMAQWFYAGENGKNGPLTEAELKEKLRSHVLPASVLVWKEGMADWVAASSLAELEISPYATPSLANLSPPEEENWETSGLQVRPWVRYWAKWGDFALFCFLGGAVAEMAAPGIMDTNDTLLGIVFLAFYVLVEPLMLCAAGTTPFRFLLNVRLRNGDGSRLGYMQGLKRSFMVLVAGLGLGIPLLTLVALILSRKRLTERGITAWDEKWNFKVSHREIAWWRWALPIVLLIGFVALISIGQNETFTE